ncbi:unnamed protein product [Auanema sp. JU1783]|nr:unnamed protein product [Auanema sp. JU1783]
MAATTTALNVLEELNEKVDRISVLILMTFILLLCVFCFVAVVVLYFLKKTLLKEKNTKMENFSTELGRCPQTSSKAANLYRPFVNSKSKTSSSVESYSKSHKTSNPLCEMPDPKTLAKAPLATRLSATQLSDITLRTAVDEPHVDNTNEHVSWPVTRNQNYDEDSGCSSGLNLI